MLLQLKKGVQLVQNMGLRYTSFRVMHELQKKAGLYRKKFPQNPPFRSFITLQEWREQPIKFLVNGSIQLRTNASDIAILQKEFDQLKEGKVTFFSSDVYSLRENYDWITNPNTGFKYDSNKHWTQINDYSKEAGDIKFVWEKSRFSFLYTIMRYDAYTGEENAEWVWKEILSWIGANPINCGPNYKCSQEISLRVLNWTFALHFYKNSDSLTEEIFQKIIFSIYWQLHHVYHNINFSRIAVRNNHALTETLALYLGGLLYPFLPNASAWKIKGKEWFEEEIAYQIYEDGTFLQFSMNYHRVAVQLLTWGIRLSELNQERFNAVVYDRAKKSLEFLTACMEPGNGWLPNYGANDGALFFKLNNVHYRDYRPQLEALSQTLGLEWEYETQEDVLWYGLKPVDIKKEATTANSGISIFNKGGYYLYRQQNSLAFIRCGKHKDRPSQADNLHLDIWYEGQNLLHDAGSYKYNTNERELKYFMGTQSHNSIMLDDFDQMEKGARFIWYHWSQCEDVKVTEKDTFYEFEGTIKAFQHIDKNIRHTRKINILKDKPLWEVEDRVYNKPENMQMKQLWHTQYPEFLTFTSQLADGKALMPQIQEGYYSSFYGKKEPCSEIVFSTKESMIRTYISIVT